MDSQTDGRTDELIWGGLGNLRFLQVKGILKTAVSSHTHSHIPISLTDSVHCSYYTPSAMTMVGKGKNVAATVGAPINQGRAEFVSRMVPRRNVAAMRGASMEPRRAEFASCMVP